MSRYLSLNISMAIFIRLCFFLHGTGALFMLHAYYNNHYYWLNGIGLVFLLVESFYTICRRKGDEYKYFWPSGLFYIASIVPVIWIIELDLLDERIAISKGLNSTTKSTNQLLPVQIYNYVDRFSKETTAKLFCEIGVIIGIILGRWLLPRGAMTRDQLSAMMLGYVATAADILELFETFDEPGAQDNRVIIICVLAGYSLALLQFPIVTSAFIRHSTVTSGRFNAMLKSPKVAPISSDVKKKTVEKSKANVSRVITVEPMQTNSKLKPTKQQIGKINTHPKKARNTNTTGTSINNSNHEDDVNEPFGERIPLLISFLMQEAPFLIFRIYVLQKYNIKSEMMIFFTCKNAIISVLIIYRFIVLSF